jgi:hypothetical protein
VREVLIAAVEVLGNNWDAEFVRIDHEYDERLACVPVRRSTDLGDLMLERRVDEAHVLKTLVPCRDAVLTTAFRGPPVGLERDVEDQPVWPVF